MVKARKFVLTREFEGEVDASFFTVVEEELPSLAEGQVLCQAVYFSVDPYQRVFGASLKEGDTMLGSQVAKIVETRHPDYPLRHTMLGYWGWRDYTVVDPKEPTPNFPPPRLLVNRDGHLRTMSLGVLGLTGIAAYVGMLDICKPQPEEVVVVSAAAGAVGSHAGQIAKIKGCKVIGLCGSDKKCSWLRDELEFDAAFNYKTDDLAKELQEAAPEGIDVYFDNVGGAVSSAVISQMRKKGRIAVCGAISSYNLAAPPMAPAVQKSMVFNQLRMEGFVAFDSHDRWDEICGQNLKWIREGKLKYKETETDGFRRLPKAFVDMMNGENYGKTVLRSMSKEELYSRAAGVSKEGLYTHADFY